MTEPTQLPTVSKINPALRDYVTGIDVPLVHPENARLGDVQAIKESLERFGQVRPILVQNSSAFVVAGNHTLKAARELGWTEIAAVGVDMEDAEALAYMIADNRLADRGQYDDTALAGTLQKLMLAGKLTGTGYSPDEVDDLLSAMDALPEVEPEDFEGDHAVTDEQLAETFRNRSLAGPLRQFVVLYPQEVGEEVEGMLTRLARAWGVTGARDVILEALRRANRNPPVEHLTAEEAALADAPPVSPVDEHGHRSEPEPGDPDVAAADDAARAAFESGDDHTEQWRAPDATAPFCPNCRSALEEGVQNWVCTSCGHQVPKVPPGPRPEAAA